MHTILLAALAWMSPALATPSADTDVAIDTVRRATNLHSTIPLTARSFRFAGGTRVRVRPLIEGLEVYGASWLVAGSGVGPLRLSGSIPPTRQTTASLVPKEEALDVASCLPLVAVPPTFAELAWRSSGQELVRSWRIPVLRDHGSQPSPWTAWIDAETGHLDALLPSSQSADALTYPTNPVLSSPERMQLPGDVPASIYAVPASCSATDPDPSALELAACEVTEQQAHPDADGNYLFIPRPEAGRDPFAEVNAFVHVDRIGAWLDDEFDFAIAWTPIDVYVNFPLANAFFGDFDGDGRPDISFGHANGADLAYDADVIYHEYGHAIVGTLAPDLPFLQADELGLDWVSGSVNEGAADVFAMLLTHDPEVGEYAGGAFGYEGGIRELSEPLRCPDDLLGEVHVDGKVFGSMFWAMILDPNIGESVAGELLMGSIALWERDISWPAVGRSVVDTANDLLDAGAISETSRGAILAHVDAANLVACDRVMAMNVGTQKSLLLFNAGLVGDFERIVGNVQLRLDPKDGANQLDILEASDGDILGWTAFVRRGSPVQHEVITVEAFGLTVAVPTNYDEVIDGVGPASLGPFEGDEPVYIAMASRNINVPALSFVTMSLTMEATVASDKAVTLAATGEPKEVQNLGCACNHRGAFAPVFPGLLLLGLIRARRSRRRRD